MLERSTSFGLVNFAHGVVIQSGPECSILHYYCSVQKTGCKSSVNSLVSLDHIRYFLTFISLLMSCIKSCNSNSNYF